jgi:hypothetical protein
VSRARAATCIVVGLVLAAGLQGCKLGRGGGDAGAGRGLLSTLATLVGFEGEIELAFRGPIVALLGTASKPPAMLLILKGDRVRMELTAGPAGPLGGATIVDGAAKKSFTLIDASKQYVETDLSAASAPAAPAAASPSYVKTGAKDTVAGYECEVAELRAATGRTEVCTSSGLAFWGLGVGPLGKLVGGGGPAAAFLSDLGGFPLRFTSYDASGAVVLGFEAMRIDKKSVPDSSFEIPAGYKKLPTTPLPTGTAKPMAPLPGAP